MTWAKFWVLLATVAGCALFYVGLKLFMPDLFQWLQERKPLIWFPAFLFIVVAAARYSKPLGWLFAAATLAVGLYSFYPAVTEFFESEVSSTSGVTRHTGGSRAATSRAVTLSTVVSDNRLMSTAPVVEVKPNLVIPWKFRDGEKSASVLFKCGSTGFDISGDYRKLVPVLDGREWNPDSPENRGKRIPEFDRIHFRTKGEGEVLFTCL